MPGPYCAQKNPGAHLHRENTILSLLQRNVLLRLAEVLVGGADDAVRELDLLDAVGTPAGHTGNRKQRGVQVLADAEHTVDQAAEQVHVGTDLLRAVLFLGKDLRGQALHSSSYSSS